MRRPAAAARHGIEETLLEVELQCEPASRLSREDVGEIERMRHRGGD
jgi:hypothetical protein